MDTILAGDRLEFVNNRRDMVVMMFKKIVVTLSLVAVLGLTGCSNTNKNENSQNNANQNNASQEVNENVDHAAVLEEIHTAVKDAYGEDYVATLEFDEQMTEEIFGLKPDMYDAIIADGPMMSAHVDTFIGVHPTEGNRQAVIDALNAYRDSQINDTMQYPQNLLKLQGSKVVETDDYVFFITLGFTDELSDTDEEQIAVFEQLNQKAIDAINGVLNQ